ncbi:MAG: PKD domain-containing protein [Candidatus Electrothrix sp. AW5]|nr:PKD domain-containing protein [Candidatus Electrothrix gigas]
MITRILLMLFLMQISTLSLFTHAHAAEPTAFSSWAKTAKIGGAAVFTGMTPQEMDQILSDMVAQKVTVIEADSDLSNYLTDAQFEQELTLMRNFSDEAHKRGLRVIWYYPSLEVVTVNGKNMDKTMAKEHPDWVQIGLDGTPNVFYGGSGQVFWVEKNDESAWMSPSSLGYRSYFLDRIRKIAATGIDGIWVDVPIYADFGPTKWSDFNPDAVAKFEQETGYTMPTAENWNDSNWRRWISWRHEEIALFLKDVTATAKSVNAELPIFAETLPTDYNGATLYGLDGSYLKHIEGLTHIWEVDSMSNNVGMRNAQEDDWISFISALKYTRSASGAKPSWVFNYGKQSDDAELVMATALSAGNNPYELQVPEMTTTVGAEYRMRMFGWAQANAPYLFEAKSGAGVAVLYSSPSRDYVDKFEGLGMFATWQSGGDSLWWAEDEVESVYTRQYLAEFRGMVKLLVHEHVPFDTVVNPANQQEIEAYQAVILPDVEAISDSEADILRQYVANGGNLIVTGPKPTGLDEYGTARSDYALADLLGFTKNDPLPAEAQNTYGNGTVLFYSDLLGKQYFVSSNAEAGQALSDAVKATSNLPLTTDADRRVHFELSHINDTTVLQFVNFIGVDGNFSVEPTSFSVTLDIPTGKQVTGVALTSPDLPDTPALSPIPYTESEQQVSFNVNLDQYALVTIFLDGAAPLQYNNTPVAGKNNFHNDLNTSLDFTDAMLLANDGDLDGDQLIVTTIDSENVIGSLADHGDGSYTYTPFQDVVGTETLVYTITDGNGGTDSGYIKISVAPPVSVYYPEAVTVTQGVYDWGTMESFTAVDEDTYDIYSASVSGGRACDWYAETSISESHDNVAQIKVTHIGQYNKAGVFQELYVYNFQDNVWDLVDTSIAGDEDDLPVSWVIDSEISDYISAEGKLRVRIRGFKSASGLQSWSNALYWEVSQAATGANTPPTAGFNSSCTDLSCTFTDQSSDTDGTVTAWTWNFGDSNSSTEQNPTHTYTAAGTYTVALTVTDDGGLPHSVSQNITVSTANVAPTAAFIFSCTDLGCSFTDSSTDSDGSIASRSWNFGDGDSSTEQNPSHIYTAEGTYTVTLTVADNDGAFTSTSQDITLTNSASQPIEIFFISIKAEDGWVRESGEYTDVGGRIASGGSGSKAIRFGDDSRKRQYKSILSFDTSSIPDSAVVLSAKLELTRGGNGGSNPFGTHGTAYIDIKKGDFGDSAALQKSDFQAPADAEQVAVIANQGESGTGYTVTLDPSALTSINSTGRTQMRLYFSLDDDNDGGNDYAGFYSGDNSNAARRPRLFVTYSEHTEEIEILPAAAFSLSCSGLSCDFNDQSTDSDGSIASWFWDFGDSNSSTEQNPTHTYTAAGFYTVILTVTDNDGGVHTTSKQISVQVGSSNSEISNPTVTLTLDGNLSDWNGLRSFGLDPDDVTGINNKLDWLEGWMAHDENNFYIAYRNEGPIDINNWWGWQIYIDADNNPATGYQLGAIGAEYHIEENMVRKYTGNGDSWSWQDQGKSASAVNGNVVELRFPQAWLGEPVTLNLAFYGENVAFSGGTTEDYYPDGLLQEQASVRFFRYNAN